MRRGKEGAHTLIIDRFESGFAVMEYEQGKTFNLPRCLLPPGAKEGDVVRITLTLDEAETTKRKRRIAGLIDKLFEP